MIEMRDGFARLTSGMKATLWIGAVSGGFLIVALAIHTSRTGERRGIASDYAARGQDPALAAAGEPGSQDPTVEPNVVPKAGAVAGKNAGGEKPTVHPWPAKPVVLGAPPSQTANGAGTPPTRTEPAPSPAEGLAQPPPSSIDSTVPILPSGIPMLPAPEGPRPSPAEIQEVASWPVPNDETLRKIRELLLDPGRSSTLKLIAIEKLRGFMPEQSTPVLAEFLDSVQPAGGAYTKPTAVKVLVDCGDETSNAALAKLARSSSDERVRVAVSCWRAKP